MLHLNFLLSYQATSASLFCFATLLKVMRTIIIVHITLRRNPIEDGAISGFSGQKSVPE